MVLRCRDTGGYCNWQASAETEEKLVKMAIRHANEAHYMKPTPELEEEARKSIRREEPRQ
jgi:predicted small metal-binding protein